MQCQVRISIARKAIREGEGAFHIIVCGPARLGSSRGFQVQCGIKVQDPCVDLGDPL
jgi:hypothetical protein